jgi:hypothetical protein
VSEDDGIKRMRGGVSSGGDTPGTAPGVRPKRIKGYYRAVKRGEPWALELKKKEGTLAFFLEWTYGPVLDELFRESLYQPNFLLRGLEKSEPWTGGVFVVPSKPEKP